nr:MAG: hypothetical protein [Apis mellifera filamentous virus]
MLFYYIVSNTFLCGRTTHYMTDISKRDNTHRSIGQTNPHANRYQKPTNTYDRDDTSILLCRPREQRKPPQRYLNKLKFRSDRATLRPRLSIET